MAMKKKKITYKLQKNELMALENIKRIAIISLFSDDYLMDIFALKGGSAINIGYELHYRESIDIDISMKEDFPKAAFSLIKTRLENIFKITFLENNYIIFDFKFFPNPSIERAENFWGGYIIEFKIIEKDYYDNFKYNPEDLRKRSIVIGHNHKKIFRIDISKNEYFTDIKEVDLEGFTIYIYGPLMIVYEKLRAICQQMDAYQKIIKTTKTPRARDFFDIYILLEKLTPPIKRFSSLENSKLLKSCFEIKKVPINLLSEIASQREFHRDDFIAVQSTVSSSTKLKNYDFYFDYVVSRVQELKPFWKK